MRSNLQIYSGPSGYEVPLTCEVTITWINRTRIYDRCAYHILHILHGIHCTFRLQDWTYQHGHRLYAIYIRNYDFDIIGLSETWLTETNKYIYNLDGYNHVPLVRPDRIHGGVSLFISTAITYRVLNAISMTNRDIECLFVEIKFNNIKIYLWSYIAHQM